MKIYLVGGAIRDTLLNLPFKDRDWVVVGATFQQMLDAGYQKVDCDFPIFLHPTNHDEYALARTERKCGLGYTGFSCYSSPNVTLEQDLQRRDLTINALAQDETGKIIDVCGGIADLKNRILRHISSAFSEDPLRVLRVARFSACYAHLNFHIAEETKTLMSNITASGELAYLTPERVWKETECALATQNPEIFFQTLRDCGALKILFPEIDMLFDEEKYLKSNTDIHTLMTLKTAAILSSEIDIRFATLFYNLNKKLRNNRNFRSIKLVEQICRRLHVPNEIRDLTKLAIKFSDLICNFSNLRPNAIIKLFDSIDAWRKPHRVEKIALVSKTGMKNSINDHIHGDLFFEAWKIAQAVPTKSIIEAGFKGIKIREELTKKRIKAIIKWRQSSLLLENNQLKK